MIRAFYHEAEQGTPTRVRISRPRSVHIYPGITPHSSAASADSLRSSGKEFTALPNARRCQQINLITTYGGDKKTSRRPASNSRCREVLYSHLLDATCESSLTGLAVIGQPRLFDTCKSPQGAALPPLGCIVTTTCTQLQPPRLALLFTGCKQVQQLRCGA